LLYALAALGEHRACRKESRRHHRNEFGHSGSLDIPAFSQQLLISSPGESPKQRSREDGFSGLIFDL
jgi:hypothetical protein